MSRCWGVLLCLAVASSRVWGVEALPVDPGHTAVVFGWTHLGYSHPVARLEKVQGTVYLDRSDLSRSSVAVEMPLDGLRTGEAELDKRLSGKYFFDVGRFPRVTFKSSKVEVVGSSDHLRITGDLSVHGITRPVVLEVTINKLTTGADGKSWAGFDAEGTVRRSEFDLGRYVPMVGDEITVHITVEARAE